MLCARKGIYDTKGNPDQPAIQQPQPQQVKQTKKKSGKKKMKKTDKTALPTSKFHDANGNTVVMHRNYLPTAHIPMGKGNFE